MQLERDSAFVTVDTDCSIKGLEKIIAEKFRISPAWQRLITKDQTLERDKTIAGELEPSARKAFVSFVHVVSQITDSTTAIVCSWWRRSARSAETATCRSS